VARSRIVAVELFRAISHVNASSQACARLAMQVPFLDEQSPSRTQEGASDDKTNQIQNLKLLVWCGVGYIPLLPSAIDWHRIFTNSIDAVDQLRPLSCDQHLKDIDAEITEGVTVCQVAANSVSCACRVE